jgi:hypothetical protein
VSRKKIKDMNYYFGKRKEKQKQNLSAIQTELTTLKSKRLMDVLMEVGNGILFRIFSRQWNGKTKIKVIQII